MIIDTYLRTEKYEGRYFYDYYGKDNIKFIEISVYL